MQTPFQSDKNGPEVTSGIALERPSNNRARDLLIAFLFIEVWLVFLHFQLALHTTPTVRALGQAFDITRESSIATYWSSLLALCVGMVCFFVAIQRRQSATTKPGYRKWIFAGVVFVCLSIDDAIAFHEKIGAITSLGLMHALNYPSYPWHVSVAPIIIICLLTAVIGIWRDVRKIKGLTALLLLALGCFAAALGLDFLEGVEEMAALQTGAASSPGLPSRMVIEELLEMVGTTFLLYVVFAYMTSQMRAPAKTGRSEVEHGPSAVEAPVS